MPARPALFNPPSSRTSHTLVEGHSLKPLVHSGTLHLQPTDFARAVTRASNAAGIEPPFHIAGFVTNDESDHGNEICGETVLGDQTWLYGRSDLQVVCAIGDPRSRRKVCARLTKEGLPLATAVHPSVVMSDDILIGRGSIVSANVTLTTGIRVGENVIVNINSSLSHDAFTEDFVTISPGVNIAGYAEIGYGAELGTGCTVLPRIRIGRGTVVGAGAVVTRDLEDNCVAIGVPARVTRILPEHLHL